MEENNEVVKEEKVINEEKKGMSIASMVLGIVGLVIFALPCGILAIIFSILGKKKGGKGFATTGLVLGIIDAVFGVIAIISSVAFPYQMLLQLIKSFPTKLPGP